MVKPLIKGVSEEKTFSLRNILKTDLFSLEKKGFWASLSGSKSGRKF